MCTVSGGGVREGMGGGKDTIENMNVCWGTQPWRRRPRDYGGGL
jgi:hypothetical protein